MRGASAPPFIGLEIFGVHCLCLDLDKLIEAKNLRLAPEERLRQRMELQRFARELERAGREATEP